MGINVASDTKAGLRFADMIVDGHKTLESRNSDTLRPYVGKRVAIVRTGEGKAKAIGEVTVGKPMVVNQKQFRAMEDEHRVPKGSRFDINTPTKHLYPMHDPVRYDEERDVGHGIVSRQVIHKARGGAVQPTIDQMRQALAKGGKVEVRPTVKDEGLMRKIPQMESAAKKVGEGKMSYEAYDKVVAKHKPVKPYEFVPKPASDEDADRALYENKKPHWRGHEKWPSGRKVGLRLDIPSYENEGVWVNSIHDEEGKGENKLDTSYGPVSSVKNATFDAGPTKAIKVATGEQNKSPFARIKGDLHHMTEDEAVEHMQKYLNHKDYAQVGMDPRRHGYFYDRKTMKPVTHAKHVVQIGPLVLAHKPTYGERESYAKGGVIHKAEGGAVGPTQEQMREALRQKMRNGMYSPLERLAVDIPRNKGTGAEFMAEISKQKGFKPEEVADRKIPIPEGKMTKLEFLKHLRQHSNPPLKEHMLQDMGSVSEARDERAHNYYGTDYDDLSFEQRLDVRDWVNQNAAKYANYQLPHGENYREMLLKLPALDPKVDRTIMGLVDNRNRTDPTEWAKNPDSQKLAVLLKQAKEAGEEYKSHHYKEHPNVLTHVRLSDREGLNGEKLLHLEELQSDWHQQGRKKGYKPKDYVEQSNSLEDQFSKLGERRYQLLKQAEAMSTHGPEFTNLIDEANSITPKLMQLQEQRDNMTSVINYGMPDAPFKKSWHELGMKHVLHHAAKNGYDGVVITPGKEQAKRWNDEGLKVHYDKKIPEFLNKFGKQFGVQMKPHAYRIEGEPQDYGDASERLGLAGVPMNQLTLDQNKRIADEADKKLHYFPINDKMRTSILKEGMPQYVRGGVVHKAEGGAVLPIERIKAQMMNRNLGLNQLQSIGAEEAPSMGIKAYVPPVGRPDNGQMPVGGVDTSQGDLPVGGIDMSRMQPGNQLMPNPAGQQPGMDQVPQGDKIPTMDGTGMPPTPNSNPNQMGSNILQMTPQGQAMAAMKPQGLAKGGSAKSVEEMKTELAAKKDPSTEKRVTVEAPGAGGVKGIVVPKHLIEGNPKAGAEGLKNMMTARAKVYGEEHRDPLNLGQMAKIHKQTLAEHFAKPLDEQKKAEDEALNKIRAAKFIKHNRDTLDESEKLDTVEHEHDAEGRSHVGYASKGIAGHALYPKGHGKDMDYKVINTCPGQTEGCGGGMNAKGIVDTKEGTCFAPNAESQYAAAVSRRAGHAIAKHDPAMTKDWVIAHTGSMRNAANKADKQNKRMLFRPNVVDETDLSSRHIIRHLNEQRKMDDKPPIIANSYGKTNELHDPENGYHITQSNVGPKVKNGREITENIGRDKARVRNTVMAADNQGDFKNEQGHKTPPKGSYMVTDVKRGSPMAKKMEGAITHAKYWTTGRSEKDLSDAEREEGPEGHFGGNGKPTTPEKAHYGHTTHEGLRYDYQKQHVLHPRLVQVGKNDDGTPHMIPTDSRFMDTGFLPKNRYKTKNGKEAGHILMTTPTESTSNIGHQTKFTHNVNEGHIEHALKNNGEYEIDKPEDQAKAKGKEYAAPQVIKFQRKPKAYAMGGSVGGRHAGFSDDDFHAFPEQNVVAQRHLAMRGDDYEPVEKHSLSDNKRKVTMNKDMDTMLLELTRNKKAK
jgi:hypothetical protein